MKRKFIALVLCMALVMSIAVPSTLAMGIASDSSDYDMAVEANASEDAVLPDAAPVVDNAESAPDAVEPPAEDAVPAQPDTSAEPEVIEPTPEAPAASAEPVPEVTAPAEPSASATPAASETPSVPAGAEQPKEPAETAAPETPAAPAVLSPEQVTATYDALMAASTREEMDNLLASLSDAELNAFVSALTAEQIEQVNGKAASFAAPESTPAPEESAQPDDRPIIYPTKNFTNVAPFLPPAEGTVPSGDDDRLLDPVNPDNGVETSKTVSGPDENGKYTLTLEAWATGEKTIIDQETQVPTDIVLVLDQSGSMADNFNSFTYEPYSGTPAQLYQKRDSLYVKRSDGSYAPVTVTKETIALDSYVSFSGESNSTYHNYSENFYHKCSDGNYGLVTVTNPFLSRNYTYSCNSCGWSETSTWSTTRPTFSSSFYKKDTANGYTFSYKDLDGKTVTASVLENESAPTWDFHISKRGASTSRMAALKNAVTTFSNSVAEKAKGPDGTAGTADDVNHRIAMVGFAFSNTHDYYYQNTELFIGSNTYRYGRISRDNYASAFQDMNTSQGISNVKKSIVALTAEGATYINHGVELGNNVFEHNPIPTGEKRNRVMIVFTDGQPGFSEYESKVASSAINQAKITKDNYQATVYSVGIFNGADATVPGNKNGNNVEKCNWFMQNLSSNNGIVQSPSYYLSAADSNALNNIFETISDNIESGGSSVQLGAETVMKDVISDSFQLPQGTIPADIKAYTANYTGENTFAPKEPFNNAHIAISKDGRTVSVTNFDYSANWVGTVTENGTTSYRGQKLIIEIPIAVRDGFLGGNGVPTNKADSGIYSDSSADKAIENFEIPSADVEIPALTVTAPDKNIYLNGNPTDAQLIEGATVQCGTETLDFSKPNYGLEPWQNAFVDVSNPSASKNCTGKEDGTYTIDVTAAPKNPGTTTAQTGTATGNIYVFKPEIEYNDSTINFGETADYETQNMTANNVVWKHGEAVANPASMIGTEPVLDCTYNPAEGAFQKDTDVCVTVTIGSEDITKYVTFLNHSPTHGNATDHQFTVYVKACTLNIQKTANAPGVFKFHVENKENAVDMDVVIEIIAETINKPQAVTIKGLPQGTYTVTEDTNWSWNFIVNKKAQTVVLAGDTRTGTAAFENTLNDKWLNDSVCVKNVPGMSTVVKK